MGATKNATSHPTGDTSLLMGSRSTLRMNLAKLVSTTIRHLCDLVEIRMTSESRLQPTTLCNCTVLWMLFLQISISLLFIFLPLLSRTLILCIDFATDVD